MHPVIQDSELGGVARAMREHLHPCDIGTWMQLIPVAFEAARRHGIELQDLFPDSTGRRLGTRDRTQSCYGWCQPWSGRVTVVVRFRDAKGEWMTARRPTEDIYRTLAHELAHFMNIRHGEMHSRAQAHILTTIQDIRRGQ
jgi:hypothetical protein